MEKQLKYKASQCENRTFSQWFFWIRAAVPVHKVLLHLHINYIFISKGLSKVMQKKKKLSTSFKTWKFHDVTISIADQFIKSTISKFHHSQYSKIIEVIFHISHQQREGMSKYNTGKIFQHYKCRHIVFNSSCQLKAWKMHPVTKMGRFQNGS